MFRQLAIFFITATLFAPAIAQEVEPERLNEITREQERQQKQEAELSKNRSKIQTDIKNLRSSLIIMAREISRLETENSELESELTGLTKQEDTIKATIVSEKRKLQELLAALQRIESNPPPALAVSPKDASDAARAAMLMSSLTQQLNQKADKLAAQLIELEAVRADIKSRQDTLLQNQSKLKAKQTTLEASVGEKKNLEYSVSLNLDSVRKRASVLAAEANDLKDLIQSLERGFGDVEPRLKPKPGSKEVNRPRPTERKYKSEPLSLSRSALRFSKAKGKITSPVTGNITKSYSTAHPGLSVRTRNKAQIKAPSAGRVEFAGAFKNYDNVVILNVDDGYFVLLTGLGQLYVQSGTMLDAGEPVGLMPVNSNSSPKLYIEVRKNGSTIDPRPWFGNSFASG